MYSCNKHQFVPTFLEKKNTGLMIQICISTTTLKKTTTDFKMWKNIVALLYEAYTKIITRNYIAGNLPEGFKRR